MTFDMARTTPNNVQSITQLIFIKTYPEQSQKYLSNYPEHTLNMFKSVQGAKKLSDVWGFE